MTGVTIQIETQEVQYDENLPDAGLWSIVVKDANQNIVTAYAGVNPWISTALDNGAYIVEAKRNDVEGTTIDPVLTESFTITPDLKAFMVVKLSVVQCNS